MPCSPAPRRRVLCPPLGASGNVSRGEWPGDDAETSPAQSHTTVPPSFPPRAWQCGLCRVEDGGCHLPAALPLQRGTHTAMLLALGALPGNSRIPMGSGSEWPRAPRVERGKQWPELLAAAARVRKPVGHRRGSAKPLQAGPRRRLGTGGRAAPHPPLVTAGASARDRGRPSSGECPAVRSGATGA